MPSREQTPFGDYLDDLLELRGLTVRSFARLIRIDGSLISAAKRPPRDGRVAEKLTKRLAYWADALELVGPERERFFELAWLAHSPPYVRDLVERQRHQISRLEKRLSRR